MITERNTNRYVVCPEKLIENSFSSAYDSASDAPIITKPDLAVTIFSCISMVILVGMCLLTAFFESKKPEMIWLIIAGIAAFLTVRIVYKHFTALKTYKNANSEGTKKFDFRSEYKGLFPADLPAEMPAAEFTRVLAPMQNRQKKAMYNNAIRDLISKLNTKNNPNDILCKNISLYGELMTQPKKRYYIAGDEGKIVVYDSDFMDPKGELVCDPDDVLSFGSYANYPSKINGKGVKVGQDAIIIEIKTGDGEDDRLYLEAHANDYDRIKKLLGGKKER